MDFYDTERIFREIEEDIIRKLVNQFRKARPDGDLEGYEWKDWRKRQLKSVRGFTKDLRRKYWPWYKRLNAWIKDFIQSAFADALTKSIKEQVGEIEDDGFFGINKTRMDTLIKATTDDMERVEAAVFRKTEDEYRQIIYKAEMALNSGMYTYDQAVDIATKDFLENGIDCVVYKNGARHTVKNYAKMVLRTNTKRAGLMAEGEMRTRLGIHTVYARWRDLACPKCMKYLGRIMVDDVYSVGTPDELIGLPEDALMLSEAMEGGFLHPNCLDTIGTYDMRLYAKDPSNDPLKKTLEYKERYEEKQRQKALEREAENYAFMAENQLTPSNRKAYEKKAEEKRQKAEELEKIVKELDKEMEKEKSA